ncbi:ABC transporter permease subunit [Faecalicatena sp. AGMB00832]|uniref:ABC transporter permease subunit n=1 Tax=Faecalicatena faecalis TaxID=2726362 RepID=A0ABS6D7Q6_9FIRM
MKNFWALTGVEYKKLLKRKTIWVTLAVLTAFAVFSVCGSLLGNVYVEGEAVSTHFEMIQQDRRAAAKFEGEKIDAGMLDRLANLEQKDSDSIPTDLFVYVGTILKNAGMTEELEGNMYRFDEDLYQIRAKALEEYWKSDVLATGEKARLREMNQKLEIPFTYHYTKGYEKVIRLEYALAVLQGLLIAICIPLIFAEEHQRKTAQVIMCSRLGRSSLFRAKIFTGITFSVLGTLLLFAAILIPAALIYGMGGFQTPIQVYFPMLPWNLNMGQMMLILLGIGLLSAILRSVIAMLLAEKFRSSTVPMAILVGFLILSSFIEIPGQFRVLSRVWACIPGNFMNAVDAFGNKLISMFGNYAGIWQAGPIFYLILSLVLIGILFSIYSTYQVKEK